MGYIYEKMKVALGGSDWNSKTFNANWTPNNIRVIVLSTEFIFIAKHIGAPTCIWLEENQVIEDLQNYARGVGKGAIHNLLSDRQFSCLEEIYFDANYRAVPSLIDLQGYINKMLNSASRLRYYGYGDFPRGCAEGLVSKYSVYDNVLYSLAKDSSRSFPLEYAEVDNKSWYRNYNLRPQYYKLDAENGNLAIYFRKNEEKIDKKLKDYAVGIAKQEYEAYFSGIIDRDIHHASLIKSLVNLMSYINAGKQKDEILGIVASEVKKVLDKGCKVKGLGSKVLADRLGKANTKPEIKEFLKKIYINMKVFDSNALAGELPDMLKITEIYTVSSDGFIPVSSLVESVYNGAKEKVSKKNSVLWNIAEEDVNENIKAVTQKYDGYKSEMESSRKLAVLYEVCGMSYI